MIPHMDSERDSFTMESSCKTAMVTRIEEKEENFQTAIGVPSHRPTGKAGKQVEIVLNSRDCGGGAFISISKAGLDTL